MLWHARRLPCPTDPAWRAAARGCGNVSHALYVVALICFVAGVLFAFVLPALRDA